MITKANWVLTMCQTIHLCYAKSLHSCPTLCDPMDCSLPGSSVHGVLQAGIQEWVTLLSSRGSSWSNPALWCLWSLWHWQAGSLPLVPPGNPLAPLGNKYSHLPSYILLPSRILNQILFLSIWLLATDFLFSILLPQLPSSCFFVSLLLLHCDFAF